ncbi:hypothetical protein [Streptomyces sp. TRM68367]|uniref:hypothetical protein n=1 Tax=Streptomyces sp. TRM68367 TaxID=2758415 RepID=UPI00165A3DA7|nr:hypothetical protein [Streptomyces sp. TRM68367]MBC9727566.1 hypothetical protein [Streptomyces sp. TRM68367]
MRYQGTVLLAGAGLVAGVPVAAWGLMGQQNAEGFAASELDYAFEPWAVPDGVAALIGAAGLLAAGAGAALLVRASRRGTLDRRWWGVLGPLVVAGVIAGVGWRILTAGVIGANIGAGLTIMFGAPLMGGLLLWALGRAAWLAFERRSGGGGEGGRRFRFVPHGT